MNTHTDKTQTTKNQSVANTVAQKKSNSNQAFALEDNRTETIQRKLKTEGTNSNVAQLGKKQRDLARAKKNNPNGLQHHNRPEYQEQNERQMELIKNGVNKKDAKRQAKAEAKSKEKD